LSSPHEVFLAEAGEVEGVLSIVRFDQIYRRRSRRVSESSERREGKKERRRKERRREKEKEKRRKEKREKKGAPAGFAATVGSMRQHRRYVTHAKQGEQRDETVIGADVGAANRRKGLREIRSSDEKRFGNDLSSMMEIILKIIFSA